jgi:hypothetical protein
MFPRYTYVALIDGTYVGAVVRGSLGGDYVGWFWTTSITIETRRKNLLTSSSLSWNTSIEALTTKNLVTSRDLTSRLIGTRRNQHRSKLERVF